VLTPDLAVYNTENQHVTNGTFGKKWKIAAMALPITNINIDAVPGSTWQNPPTLSDTLRITLAAHMQR
jgi:hypothetical protein